MIVQENVHLATKNTMKIGGFADRFYIPESEEELVRIAQENYDKNGKVYILSGGSNLLINDRRFEQVIYMSAACTEMTNLGDGKFYIGASNRIPKVISFVNQFGYGGFEGLVGLPAMFGGILYMNAGLGGEKNPAFTIGDFVLSVRLWNLAEKKFEEFDAQECGFKHRYSVFHNQQYVILGAVIQCKKVDINDAKKVKEARLQFCKNNFEYGKGCFGTCFSKVNYKLLKVVSMLYSVLKFGNGRVTFAKNNVNWLVNHGNGSYEDAIRIINLCKQLHRLCRKDIMCEVVIWE